MTCGAPVVVSDLPGLRVPVMKTGMGCIVPPANADELAQSILAILEQPEKYRGQAEALLRLTTSQAVAEQYETIFSRLLSQGKTQVKSERAQVGDG
jgi:glycosyltransferase involved in cell wall biosynthesis